jgi:Site-specific recombinase XerD
MGKMKRRTNGEGSIYFEKARGTYRVFITNPEGKRLSKRCHSEQEALNWKNEQLHKMAIGTFVNPNNLTVGEWIVHWLETYKKNTIRQRTFERYASLSKHLSSIAHYKIQELTPVIVQQLYTNLLTVLSANTIAKVHKLLKDSFNKATELSLIEKNIMQIVKPPKFEQKDIEIFTAEEIHDILNTIKSTSILERYYPMVLLAATTGMRLGEVLGLRWCDVNPTDNTLFIRTSLQHSSALGLISEKPKTKAAIRKIRIPSYVMTELKNLKIKQKILDISQESLCFLTKNSTPIAPRNFERFWDALFKKYELSIPYKKFHTLRHTHATELLAAGIPLSDVAKRLGHSKQSHTLELYAHAMPNKEQAITDAIENLLIK